MAKLINLIGQRFGRLIVIEKVEKGEDKYSRWKCRCDCGGEIIVNTKRLKEGVISNCGCLPKKHPNKRGSIAVDLSGKRFGRLTVLSREKNNNYGKTCWLCNCDCGNLVVVTANKLLGGNTRSCGCLVKDTAKNMADDLTKKKFGRLTALYATNKRSKSGSIYWHCVCDCGNEIDVVQSSLVHGSTISCGCYLQEIKDSIHDTLTFVDDTCVDWLRKRKNRKDNTSGFRGVRQIKNGKWSATIGLQSKQYYIGAFNTYEEAVEARLEVEKILHDGFIVEYEKWVRKAKEDSIWAERNPFFFKVEKTDTGFIAITPFSRLQSRNI